MLLSEIGNKEIVDLSTGCSHGELWNAELLFEKKSGKIKSDVSSHRYKAPACFIKSQEKCVSSPGTVLSSSAMI